MTFNPGDTGPGSGGFRRNGTLPGQVGQGGTNIPSPVEANTGKLDVHPVDHELNRTLLDVMQRANDGTGANGGGHPPAMSVPQGWDNADEQHSLSGQLVPPPSAGGSAGSRVEVRSAGSRLEVGSAGLHPEVDSAGSHVEFEPVSAQVQPDQPPGLRFRNLSGPLGTIPEEN